MKAAITEITVSMGADDEAGAIYGDCTAKIKVDDEGAGPYLVITGSDLTLGGENPNSFYLCSNADIDAFAKLCKRVLKSAETWNEK